MVIMNDDGRGGSDLNSCCPTNLNETRAMRLPA